MRSQESVGRWSHQLVNHSPLDIGDSLKTVRDVVCLLVSEGCGRLPLQGGAPGSSLPRAKVADALRDRTSGVVSMSTCTGRFVFRNGPHDRGAGTCGPCRAGQQAGGSGRSWRCGVEAEFLLL